MSVFGGRSREGDRLRSVSNIFTRQAAGKREAWRGSEGRGGEQCVIGGRERVE